MVAPEGLVYIPDVLSRTEQEDLLQGVRALRYTHDVFRGQTLKRGYAQFGYAYVSTGRKLTAAPPMPAFLQTLREKTRPYYPKDILLAQCIVTQYPPGAGIGWHTDAPVFGEYIVGVSLAAAARLQFKPNRSQDVSYELTVSPGSIYVMHGTVRWQYQHQLVPVKIERYSLTFRSVAQA